MKIRLAILALTLTVSSTVLAEGVNWGKVKDGLYTYVLNPMLQTNNPELMRGKVIGQETNTKPQITVNMTAGQIIHALNYYEKQYDQKIAEYVQANRDDLHFSKKTKILCEAESAAIAAINVMQLDANRNRKDLPASLLATISEKHNYYDEQRKEMVYEQQRLNQSNVNCFDYFPYQ
ncbi:hypothetical protein M1L59_09565 [Acinetobacter schindleri]|uniref:hypothetical protein n=1 Tax=Acinetobacter schindleri TaxID=108981 RepID=UPI00200AE013|nr:hypothetical protein [Acinetobacter schindleri]MCK8640942.1 hypothetical protein [Acinetobacter schindleri]MEB5928540.1 hypothetical protein [Acinetobacter schindleri]